MDLFLPATDSAHVEWRLGLARALAWGGRGRESERELQRLIARRGPDSVVVGLLRVARGAIRDASIGEARGWLAGRGLFFAVPGASPAVRV